MTLSPRSRLKAAFRRYKAASTGNVAIIAAAIIAPLALGLGVGVDYTFASYRQDQINGFADSSTLAAVTPSMMASSPATTAQLVAYSAFTAQLATIPNIVYNPANITVTAVDTTCSSNCGGNFATVTRTVTLNYTISSQNIFSGVLGMATIPFSGTSKAVASTAPNINFYMLLDNSPSMAIAATTSGISTMVANTAPQGGCAFACHESNPAADGLGNPICPTGNAYCVAGQPEDNFAVARNLGVTLRIDLVNNAVQSLLQSASSEEGQYHTSYGFAIYTMNTNASGYTNSSNVNYFPTPALSKPQDVSTMNAAGVSIAQVEYCKNGWVTCSINDNDTDSALDTSMATLNANMPTPGNGTNSPTDSPQEVMFVVTDGVNDFVMNSNRVMNPIGTNTSICQTVKNKGIRIAMLYLTYNPLPTNSFYVQNIQPFQPNISTDAQSCASPGLYFEVNTDGDITSAMTTLFQRAVATARLSQ